MLAIYDFSENRGQDTECVLFWFSIEGTLCFVSQVEAQDVIRFDDLIPLGRALYF